MEKDALTKYKNKLKKLNSLEVKKRDVYLRQLSNGELYGPLTGYPSIDKPWLKWYSEEILSENIPHMSMYDYMLYRNTENRQRTALNYHHKRITYQELFDNVDRFTNMLDREGIQPKEVVTVSCLTTPELIYSIFALNRLGAVANIVDPRNGIEALKKFINDVDSKIIIISDCFLEKFNSVVDGTSVTKTIAFPLYESCSDMDVSEHCELALKYREKCDTEGDDISKNIAAIVYTGGTTGISKGVMLTNYNFVAMAESYSKSDVSMKLGETFLSIIPPFFPYGICFSIYVPLALGAETICIPIFDAKDFPSLMNEYKPNHVMGVPKYYENMAHSPITKDMDLSFLKVAGCGGDSIPVQKEIEINDYLCTHNSCTKLMKGYGLTEVSSAAASNTKLTNKLGSVGIPFIYNNISIFKPDTDDELTYGNSGEVCISTPMMMLGYMNNIDGTKKMIKQHSDGKYWVHTGDSGKMDDDGNIFINTRYKRIILRRGMTIYPNAIENIIMSNKNIENAAVVRKYDEEFINVPVACIIIKESSTDQENLIKQLRKACIDNLPEYAVPVNYVIFKEFPRTRMGKIDYLALEKGINDGKSS